MDWNYKTNLTLIQKAHPIGSIFYIEFRLSIQNNQQEMGISFYEDVLQYLLNAGGLDEAKLQAFWCSQQEKESAINGESEMTSFAQSFYNIGHQEGSEKEREKIFHRLLGLGYDLKQVKEVIPESHHPIKEEA